MKKENMTLEEAVDHNLKVIGRVKNFVDFCIQKGTLTKESSIEDLYKVLQAHEETYTNLVKMSKGELKF